MTEPWQHVEIALQDLYDALGSGIESGEFDLEAVRYDLAGLPNLHDNFTLWWKHERKQ